MHKDSSRAGMTIPKRCSSIVDPPVANPPISRELIRSKRLFEIQEMHQSALRLLGMYELQTNTVIFKEILQSTN